MYFVLSIFAAAVVFVLLWTLYIWHVIKKSIRISEPLIAHTTMYEQYPYDSHERILILGDSIGVGVGAVEPSDSLAGRIGQDYQNATITNVAVSGSRLNDLKESIDEHLGETYDLVFISIGGNDITHGTSKKNMETVLAYILRNASMLGTQVIVVTAGNVGLSPAFVWPFSNYIEWRTRVARTLFMNEVAHYKNIAYIDLFNERKDEIFNTDIPKYYAPDRFHPSSEGYAVWYEKIQPVIKDFFKE